YRDGQVAVHVHATDLDGLHFRKDRMGRDDEQHDFQEENRADSTSHRRALTSGREGWRPSSPPETKTSGGTVTPRSLSLSRNCGRRPVGFSCPRNLPSSSMPAR